MGVGVVVAWGLLTELPELRSVSRQAVAALAWLAPMERRSGQRSGVRRLRGGRVRRVLYQVAVVAVRCEGRWRGVSYWGVMYEAALYSYQILRFSGMGMLASG